MKIENGNRYYRRDGLLSGMIVELEGSYKWKFKDLATGHCYTENGSFSDEIGHKYDLVRKESSGDYKAETITLSAEEYSEMQDHIKEQKELIDNLKARVRRKNSIMKGILMMCEDELEPEEVSSKSPLLKAVSEPTKNHIPGFGNVYKELGDILRPE